MKKFLTYLFAGALALAFTNCTTTYDAYGNPRQSVDPGTAVAGAAAVGVLGYALANKQNNRQNYRQNYRHYDNGPYYRPDHYHHY